MFWSCLIIFFAILCWFGVLSQNPHKYFLLIILDDSNNHKYSWFDVKNFHYLQQILFVCLYSRLTIYSCLLEYTINSKKTIGRVASESATKEKQWKADGNLTVINTGEKIHLFQFNFATLITTFPLVLCRIPILWLHWLRNVGRESYLCLQITFNFTF